MTREQLELALTNAQIELLEEIGYEHGKIISEYSARITNLVTLFFDPKTVVDEFEPRQETR